MIEIAQNYSYKALAVMDASQVGVSSPDSQAARYQHSEDVEMRHLANVARGKARAKPSRTKLSSHDAC